MPTYDTNVTITEKPTVSYSVTEKPTVSYSVTAKATSPTTTRVPKPYLEPLAILTEDGVEILYENEIVMVMEGEV